MSKVRRERPLASRVVAVALAALAAAAAIVYAPVTAVQAAGPRPAFQMPFPCGQQWQLNSYDSSHAPALDMVKEPNQVGTEGATLIAPAAGRVNQSFWHQHADGSGAGNVIQIDHGGGWFTTYIHLQSRAVSVGTQVTQGQLIGRVGHTGTTSNGHPHLHFEMAIDANGNGSATWGFAGAERVASWFNGVQYGAGTGQNYRNVTSNNLCTGPGPGPGPTPGKVWVDTFANAPVYASETSTAQTGTLYAGTNYVYCRIWGREIRSGANFNHWWLKTDPDVGPANQYVSAYYLSRWGNDVAKDNSGNDIPDCVVSKFWVDTFANAPVFASPTSTTQTGTLYAGTNYVYCRVWGREIRDGGGAFNHWWLKTDPDVGPAKQYVSAYYLSRWGNDVAKDNSGNDIKAC